MPLLLEFVSLKLINIEVVNYVTGYVVIGILISAAIAQISDESKGSNMNLMLLSSILLAIVSNTILVLSKSSSGLSGKMEHILMLASFFCIYKGLIEISLKSPFKLLYHKSEANAIQLQKAYQNLVAEINERQCEQEESIRKEQQYSLLFEVLPIGVAVQKDNCITFANNEMKRLFAVKSRDELIGKNFVDFLKVTPEYDDLGHQRKNEADIDKRATTLLEQKYVRYDGEAINVDVASIPFKCKGEEAVLTIIQDISERKRMIELEKKFDMNIEILEETLEIDRHKSEFFANITHEFRTPLNVILGTIQLLDLNIKGKSYLETKIIERKTKIMKQNSLRLLRLINNIIDVTKLDAGFFEIHPQNTNIIKIVEEITLSVADYAKDRDVDIIFDTDIEEKMVACDPDIIERVILNLLSNAIKFTEKGGTINVAMQCDAHYITISVKDTGIGIQDDNQEIIFERYRQVDKSLTRNHEGSGIGLSLVKSLIEMLNGEISVKSEYGKGSEFIIVIPYKLLEKDDFKEVSLVNNARHTHVERIMIEFSDVYSLNLYE